MLVTFCVLKMSRSLFRYLQQKETAHKQLTEENFKLREFIGQISMNRFTSAERSRFAVASVLSEMNPLQISSTPLPNADAFAAGLEAMQVRVFLERFDQTDSIYFRYILLVCAVFWNLDISTYQLSAHTLTHGKKRLRYSWLRSFIAVTFRRPVCSKQYLYPRFHRTYSKDNSVHYLWSLGYSLTFPVLAAWRVKEWTISFSLQLRSAVLVLVRPLCLIEHDRDLTTDFNQEKWYNYIG